jgi:hypothetical protein
MLYAVWQAGTERRIDDLIWSTAGHHRHVGIDPGGE